MSEKFENYKESIRKVAHDLHKKGNEAAQALKNHTQKNSLEMKEAFDRMRKKVSIAAKDIQERSETNDKEI